MIGYTLRHRVRFVKYTVLGVLAFSFDLGLLYIGNTVIGLHYALAVPTAFLIATSLHYLALRYFVFADTERGHGAGYVYFLSIMILNAVVITIIIAGLIEYFMINLYVARIGVGACFGLLSFFLNSRYNFKIL